MGREHRPVVLLGTGNQARVLLGVELIVLGRQAVSAQIADRVALQLHQLLDDAATTGLADPQADGSPVLLALAAEVLEAGVALAGPGRRRRIDLLEVGDHLLDRRVEAVEVKAIEPRGVGGIAAVVVRAQPADEVEHLGVSPHPGGEALEAAQRLLGIRVLAGPAHIAVHPVGVGPIGLDGDPREALLLDQPACDQGALAVELVAAVGGLSEQHEAGVADQIQQRVVVIRQATERMNLARKDVQRRLAVARRRHPRHRSALGAGSAGLLLGSQVEQTRGRDHRKPSASADAAAPQCSTGGEVL